MKREENSMDPETLASCAAALGRDEGAILHLRDEGDLLAALLAGMLLERRRKNAASQDDDHAGRLCQALRTGFGTQRFTTGDLVKWAESGHSSDSRTALRAARAMCQVEKVADLTVQMLGMELARLARIDGARLVRDGEIRGSAVWRLRDLRD